MSNVIKAPHIAGVGDDGCDIFAELVIENLRRYVEGAAPSTVSTAAKSTEIMQEGSLRR